jgi:hypothetical protein
MDEIVIRYDKRYSFYKKRDTPIGLTASDVLKMKR